MYAKSAIIMAFFSSCDIPYADLVKTFGDSKMSEVRKMRAKVFRQKQLKDSFQAARLYRIFSTSKGYSIKGGQEGMVKRMLEAHNASPRFNRAFLFEEIEITKQKEAGRIRNVHEVGAAEFQYIPHSTHGEYRMRAVVPEKYSGKEEDRKRRIFENHLFPHARYVSKAQGYPIRVDVICKPVQKELMDLLVELKFELRTPWDGESELPDGTFLVYSKVLSHKDGDQKAE